ncbi:MAG: FAD-dependent monooxygenase, partial [Acidimicrobiia bacterium]|nr:FAD-dependent monooxygenase [Acidimicrobiia bacterium]
VVRRCDLDAFVAEHAAAAGAELRLAHEAIAPLVEGSTVVGARVRDNERGTEAAVRADYVVVAEGANSSFGRQLGISRNRSLPMGMAIRGYYHSPLSTDPWIESCLDLRDRDGNAMPGYGWIFPVGNGLINVGVGLLSTFKHYRSVNTSHLLDAYADTAPGYWGISTEAAAGRPTGGRLPMGGSVTPIRGPNWLVVGDAAGTVNPFNGEGIDYAYETGRMAAGVLHTALEDRDPRALACYERQLTDEFGAYFKVARLFAQVIGRPVLMRELTRVGMHSRSLMEWVLRIMANLLRPDEVGPAEAAYRAAAALARIVPEPGLGR